MRAVAEFVQTTVIGWNGDTQALARWFEEQQQSPANPACAGTLAVGPAAVITVEPFPSEKSQPRKCFANVESVVASLGGSFAFGWSLGHQGPLLVGDRTAAPLYSRWVNHVVWRDGAGALWEVTPHIDAEDPTLKVWRPTIFVLDERAEFKGLSPQLTQHTPLRPEGEVVANLLNQAQQAESDQARLKCLRMAFAAIQQHGFRPKQCRVETIGKRTSNILLFAE